jgi:Integron cassette protein VCH_CASS1 chain
MSRANHHAANVMAIAPAMLGGIVWRADPGSVEIKTYGGKLANIIWFEINKHRYAVAYSHAADKIEIRDRTQSGPALHSFDNATAAQTVETAFRNL